MSDQSDQSDQSAQSALTVNDLMHQAVRMRATHEQEPPTPHVSSPVGSLSSVDATSALSSLSVLRPAIRSRTSR